jgi:PEP-CTERM motif-containing protein
MPQRFLSWLGLALKMLAFRIASLRRGGQMKRLSYILGFLMVAPLLLFVGSVTKADGIDPKIGLGPTGSQHTFNQDFCHQGSDSQASGCSFTSTGPTDIVTIDIINNLGAFIVGDTVTMRDTFTGPLLCPANAETAPNWVGATSTDGQSCIFTGGFISPGFKYGLTFSLFAAGTYRFDISETTSAPEPGTIILLGAGLVAALAAGRKRLKGASTSSSDVC